MNRGRRKVLAGAVRSIQAVAAACCVLTLAQHVMAQDGGGEAAKVKATEEQLKRFAFDLPSADGVGELSFTQLCESGKPFILIWWLSDCPVCHLQMPYIQQLQRLAEGGEANLRIVTVNVDQTCDGCLKYAEDRSLSFEILSDPRARETDKGYRVKEYGTPVTYVFKAGGEYVDVLTGFRSGYAKSVLKLLDQEIPASLDGR